MPTIRHNNRIFVLKTKRLKCLDCKTFCETSKPYPNTAMCRCGNVKVDGGISMGATISGNIFQMEDHSVFRTEDKPKIQLEQDIVTTYHDMKKQTCLANQN